MPESRKPRMRSAHTAPAVDRTVPLPIGTRVMRIPVEPCSCCGDRFGLANANRRPPQLGVVMCHSEAVNSPGQFSVRWDDTQVWEAHLDTSYVTVVAAQDATVTPLSRSTRRRAS